MGKSNGMVVPDPVESNRYAGVPVPEFRKNDAISITYMRDIGAETIGVLRLCKRACSTALFVMHWCNSLRESVKRLPLVTMHGED